MYKLSVPIMSSTVHEGNRETYVRLCREAGVDRVFLVGGSIMEPIPPTLGENVAYFKAQGFEVGIWTDTIGHGVKLSHVSDSPDTPTFPYMVDLAGDDRPYTNCPLDSDFRAYIAKFVAALAKTGTDIVMLDDDFRMSQHGTELCCACPAHLARIGEILGEGITLEALRPHVIGGKANRYRDAWLRAQNEGLTEMARTIRAEVDRETPDVTLCICTALCPWDVDGVNVEEIAQILAGKNQPILRLTGAPYWACKTRRFPLITVFEIARMLAAFVSDRGFDLMSEGDVYPRPRYTCPASYLELFDAVTRLDGNYGGILKYMFDYVASPALEMGYLRLHNENRETVAKMAELFQGGANTGVRVITRPHLAKHADFNLSPVSQFSPRPFDGAMLGASGVPTVYNQNGICSSVFGENARMLDLTILKDGVMLDAVSARILTERGVDVGLAEEGQIDYKKIDFVCTSDPEYKSLITDGNVRVLTAQLNARAEPLLFISEHNGNTPLAYRFENAHGERFLVFLFDLSTILQDKTGAFVSGLTENPVTRRVLTENLPWIARKSLPITCEDDPNLYLMCRADGDSLSVALFNCFADPVLSPTLTLGDHYARIECVGCEATLEGNRVTLTSRLHGFEFAAFRVWKN